MPEPIARRPANLRVKRGSRRRDGQSTIEYLAVLALVATLIGGGILLTRTSLAPLIAATLGRTSDATTAPSPAAQEGLATALRGDPSGPTLLGARARLAEDVGPAVADRILADALQTHLATRHGKQLAAAVLSEPLGDAGRMVAHAAGRPRLRLVSPADEARASLADDTRRDRDLAAGEAVAWSATSTLLNGLRRHLGTGVGALRLLLAASATHDPLPPGARAGDLVVCLPVLLRLTERPGTRPGWRIIALRRDRIVDDRIAASPVSCAGPADTVLPTGPPSP